jgi:RNA polymerase sigma-70 factor (family 1)
LITIPLHSDSELLVMIAQGSKSAFDIVYNTYSKSLFRFARKNIAIKEDCEEIIQNIFLDLWNRREQLAHITSLEAYLYQMVRYSVIRYFQHKKVVQKFEAHYAFFEVMYENPQTEFDKKEDLREQLMKSLTGLPDRCREALRLRIFENLSNGEIADRMSITKGTVENYMVTAFEHIRNNGQALIKSV